MTLPGQSYAVSASHDGRREADLPAAGAQRDVPGQRHDVLGPLPQRRHLHHRVDQPGQRRRDVLEPVGGHRDRDAAEQVAQPLGHPGRQRVDVPHDHRGVRLADLRRPEVEPRLHVGRGRRARRQDPRRRPVPALRPGPAASSGPSPAPPPRPRRGRRRAPHRPAAGRRPRRATGRAACPRRARAGAPRPGTPRRAAWVAACRPADRASISAEVWLAAELGQREQQVRGLLAPGREVDAALEPTGERVQHRHGGAGVGAQAERVVLLGADDRRRPVRQRQPQPVGAGLALGVGEARREVHRVERAEQRVVAAGAAQHQAVGVGEHDRRPAGRRGSAGARGGPPGRTRSRATARRTSPRTPGPPSPARRRSPRCAATTRAAGSGRCGLVGCSRARAGRCVSADVIRASHRRSGRYAGEGWRARCAASQIETALPSSSPRARPTLTGEPL